MNCCRQSAYHCTMGDSLVKWTLITLAEINAHICSRQFAYSSNTIATGTEMTISILNVCVIYVIASTSSEREKKRV